MEIRNIVTFQAPHFLPASQMREGSDQPIDSCESESKFALATFIVGSLRDQGFECKVPYRYTSNKLKKFRHFIFFDVFVNSYRYWCLLGWEDEHQWFVEVFSMSRSKADLHQLLYDEKDAQEWRAVCKAVDEILRSDSQITDIRWLSYGEIEKEDEPKDLS